MIWRTSSAQQALLELLVRGSLKRRQGQAEAFDALAELPWTKLTGRRDELALVAERRADLIALLDHVWPDWGAVCAALTANDLPATPEGLAALRDRERSLNLPTLPDQLNRRTAAALLGPHSKSSLSDRRTARLGDTETTQDGIVRVRPSSGLTAVGPAASIALDAVAAVFGEVALPERALKSGVRLAGEVAAVLLVENLGTYCDVRVPEGWIVAHVPGWDTATVSLFLRGLSHVPAVHFGDLDPNGLRIFRHLQREHPDLRWFVPDFWAEHMELRALPCDWPAELTLADAPELVQLLAERGAWLEQEAIALDPRLSDALQRLLRSDGDP